MLMEVLVLVLGLAAALAIIFCYVFCIREVVKDVKRWIKIFKDAKDRNKVEYAEDDEEEDSSYPVLRLVKPHKEEQPDGASMPASKFI